MNKSKGEDKLNRRGRPTRAPVDIETRAFAPRQNPLPAPPLEIDAAPFVCLVVNMSWVSHVLGVIETLNQDDAWVGDAEEKDRARQEIQKLLVQLMTGDNCVFDPCCPETNELLTQIRNLNISIVNNQETTIAQTNTQIINYYSQQLQTFITQNYETHILNQMLYDGTPQSVGEHVPQINWNRETAEDTPEQTAALEDALCEAVIRYIRQQIYVYSMQAAIGSLVVGVLAGIASILTAGAAIPIGLIITTAAGAVAAGFAAVINDSEAQRLVACCIFENLKDASIDHDSFTNSMAACSFEDNVNAQFLADQLENCSLIEGNYLAFLRMLSDAQLTGNRNNCDCCQEIEDYELVAVNDCVVTKINDFQYRVEQTNYTVEDLGGILGPTRIFVASIKEIEDRCFDIISGSGGGAHDYSQTNCEGILEEGTGGGGGSVTQITWRQFRGDPDPEDIHLDTVLTIACPQLGLQGG